MDSAMSSTSSPPASLKSSMLTPKTPRIDAPANAETMQPMDTAISAVTAIFRRSASEAPSVKDRKIGTLAIGFMIANSAEKTLIDRARSNVMAVDSTVRAQASCCRLATTIGRLRCRN
jgi:hypothetical protein